MGSKRERKGEKEKDVTGNPCKSHGSKKRYKHGQKEENDQNDDGVDKEEERGGGGGEIARVAETWRRRREKFETSVRNYSVRTTFKYPSSDREISEVVGHRKT